MDRPKEKAFNRKWSVLKARGGGREREEGAEKQGEVVVSGNAPWQRCQTEGTAWRGVYMWSCGRLLVLRFGPKHCTYLPSVAVSHLRHLCDQVTVARTPWKTEVGSDTSHLSLYSRFSTSSICCIIHYFYFASLSTAFPISTQILSWMDNNTERTIPCCLSIDAYHAKHVLNSV